MAKKTKKVKANKVQSKKKTVKKKIAVKKKVAKKKATKKKTVKKTTTKKVKKATKKKASKKVVKRKRKKKLTMDDVYKILNKVQINKKKITFAMFINESSTAENIIRDTELRYHKKIMKTQVVFTIYPRAEDEELDILDIDYLEDEIPEEGQIFG